MRLVFGHPGINSALHLRCSKPFCAKSIVISHGIAKAAGSAEPVPMVEFKEDVCSRRECQAQKQDEATADGSVGLDHAMTPMTNSPFESILRKVQPFGLLGISIGVLALYSR